jgi:transcriptional regulator with XRE-family HTH domain
MKGNSKSSLQEIEEIFSEAPSINQKAWGIINDFYHFILSRMENEGISKADLANRLGISRSAISQMFNKTPNLTIKKMVEIADSVGVDLTIIPTDLKKEIGNKAKVKYIYVVVKPGDYRQELITNNDSSLITNCINYVYSQYDNVSNYRRKRI